MRVCRCMLVKMKRRHWTLLFFALCKIQFSDSVHCQCAFCSMRRKIFQYFLIFKNFTDLRDRKWFLNNHSAIVFLLHSITVQISWDVKKSDIFHKKVFGSIFYLKKYNLKFSLSYLFFFLKVTPLRRQKRPVLLKIWRSSKLRGN